MPRGRGSNSPWSARHVLRERKTLRHVQDPSAAPAGDGVACPFACRSHEATSGKAVQIGALRCRVKGHLGAIRYMVVRKFAVDISTYLDRSKLSAYHIALPATRFFVKSGQRFASTEDA